MNEENRLIIKQLNKFGRIPETSELLKMIEDLEKEKTMYKTSFEEMSKNYFELQNNWNELKKFVEDEIIECKAIINTILPEFEKIMPRSSGKTVLTNEYNQTQTIIKCFEVMLNKMQEMESDVSG